MLWPRDPETFAVKPKVVAPYRSRANAFFYTEDEFYGSTDTYFIVADEATSLRAICAYLNSSLSLVWFKNMGKVKGDMLDLTGDNLELFPIPIHGLEHQATMNLEELVNEIQGLLAASDSLERTTQSTEYINLYMRIDEIVLDAYGLTTHEKAVVREEALSFGQA